MKSFRTIGVVYRGSANEHALGEMPAAEFPFWKNFLLHNFLLLESCMYNFFRQLLDDIFQHNYYF